MLVLTLAVNTVSVQADALDYLGNTIDGSVLTNETESIGNYQSVARSTYLHQGFVRITNNGNESITYYTAFHSKFLSIPLFLFDHLTHNIHLYISI